MKIDEIMSGQQAQFYMRMKAQAEQWTVKKLITFLKSDKSTLPQNQTDELIDALGTVSGDKVLNHKDLENLAFSSGADLDELENITGIVK